MIYQKDIIQVSLIVVQKMLSSVIHFIHIFEVYYSQGGYCQACQLKRNMLLRVCVHLGWVKYREYISLLVIYSLYNRVCDK